MAIAILAVAPAQAVDLPGPVTLTVSVSEPGFALLLGAALMGIGTLARRFRG